MTADVLLGLRAIIDGAAAGVVRVDTVDRIPVEMLRQAADEIDRLRADAVTADDGRVPDTEIETRTEYRVAGSTHVPDPPVTSQEHIEAIAGGARVESRQVTTTTTRTAWTETSTTNQPEESPDA